MCVRFWWAAKLLNDAAVLCIQFSESKIYVYMGRFVDRVSGFMV